MHISCSLMPRSHIAFTKFHEHKTPLDPTMMFRSSVRLRGESKIRALHHGWVNVGADIPKRPLLLFELELASDTEGRKWCPKKHQGTPPYSFSPMSLPCISQPLMLKTMTSREGERGQLKVLFAVLFPYSSVRKSW